MIHIFYIQNRLGITEAQENTRKSDCINSRFCFYVPVVNGTAVSRDGTELSQRAESGQSGVSSLSLGLVVKPVFVSQAVSDSITILGQERERVSLRSRSCV